MTANEGQFGRGFTAIELEATTSGRGWGSAADGGILEPGSGGVRGGLQRVYQRLKQPAVLLGIAGALLILLVAAAAYSTGRRSGRLQVSGCAGLTAPALQGDTVAPEGSIEGSFEALHDYRGRPRSVTAAGGLVAADNGRCSEIGAAVLREGGNAVDAAIATALCQGVLNPQASGAGGGHFMLIRLPNGTAECIDAREFAPGAANETMFVDRPDASISGGLAVAVPLELRGMWTAHHRHGRLPWKRLFQPAIKLAASGFPAHPYLGALFAAALLPPLPQMLSLLPLNG
jgi:hypothetical protein